jgi:hypothetical protein
MEEDYTEKFDRIIELLVELVNQIKEMRKEIRNIPKDISGRR